MNNEVCGSYPPYLVCGRNWVSESYTYCNWMGDEAKKMTTEEILAMNLEELRAWLCDCNETEAGVRLYLLRKTIDEVTFTTQFICKNCNEITSAKNGTEQQKAELCSVCFLLNQRRKR